MNNPSNSDVFGPNPEFNPAKRIKHPGIIFPDSPLHPQFKEAGKEVIKEVIKKPRKKNKPPVEDLSIEWGVTTQFVARKMGTSTSAARQYLHRRNVPYNFVKIPLISPRVLIWDRLVVGEILKDYIFESTKVPENYICTRDALTLLNITATTLYRLQKNYDIPTILIQYGLDKYKRYHRFYNRISLLKASKKISKIGNDLDFQQ